MKLQLHQPHGEKTYSFILHINDIDFILKNSVSSLVEIKLNIKHWYQNQVCP